MSNYSDISGMISYNFIEDETIDKIKTFLTGDGIIDGLNEIFGARGRNLNHTYSMFKDYAEVDNFEISIDRIDVNYYDLKEEITVIVKFLNDIGVTGITVDIDRKGEDGYGDTEHFKTDDNGKVVSSMAKIVYGEYN